jgi:hypothetical protein
VDITTIDLYVKGATVLHLDLVKIDTQGFDAKVIRGMETSIAAFRPMLVFEYEEWAWDLSEETLERLGDWLSLRGYSIWVLEEFAGQIRLSPLTTVPSHADLMAVHSEQVGKLGDIWKP